MRAVVTGATGYIGGRMIDRLLGRGWSLSAVVIPADSAPLSDGVKRLEDPGTALELACMLKDFAPDVALHLAASQTLADTPADSDLLVDANLSFAGRMLAASHAAGVRGFVAAGTYSAHADGTAAYAPQTLYAATKQAFADLAAHYRRNTEMPVTVLELSDTYGPGDARPKFLNLLDKAARTGEVLDATPGLQVVRPLHVDDIADAFAHAAELLTEGRDVPLVCSVAGPDAVTLRELREAYAQATGSEPPVRWGAREYRPGEIMAPWCGPELPGWKPSIRLAQGLAMVYAPEHEQGTTDGR